MHPGQLTVTVETVRGLVDRQFPGWRDLPVRPVRSQGTVNALFRLGETLVARFPLVPADVGAARLFLRSEARAARELLGRTRFPTPEPVALGEPGPGYPSPWSVQTWLPDTVATVEDPGGSVAFAHDLAQFVRDRRAIDTRGRPFRGSGRGGALPDHDGWMWTCFERSERLLDVAPLRRLWAELRELPPSPGGDVMTHGDLIPGNVLVAGSRLVGVIDVGGAGPADPALDLVGAWHLLDAGPRHAFRAALCRDPTGRDPTGCDPTGCDPTGCDPTGCDPTSCDDVQWARGMAWALEQAMGVVWYYADSNPAMSRMGRRTLQRLAVANGPASW